MSGVELAWETPREWGAVASRQPIELLNDHAHCELQAAVACQSLIARYPDRPRLVDAAAEVAQEELVHFQRVVGLMRELGGELTDGGPNPYAEGIRKGSGPTRKHGLLDRLLVAALIERRSCERFELLAAHSEHPDLQRLYEELAPEEIRHQALFFELACHEVGSDEAHARMAQLVAIEAEVIAKLEFQPRMHSGAPA